MLSILMRWSDCSAANTSLSQGKTAFHALSPMVKERIWNHSYTYVQNWLVVWQSCPRLHSPLGEQKLVGENQVRSHTLEYTLFGYMHAVSNTVNIKKNL